MSTVTYAYLTLFSGNRVGKRFLLDPADQTTIGRGADCAISLPDPLCSRVHAVITCDGDRWSVRDVDSRNGTLVNGKRVNGATLDDGTAIRVGATDLAFRTSSQPLTSENDPGWTQTIVQDVPIAESQADAPAAIADADKSQELPLLYQLSIRLLGNKQPEEAVRVALDILHDQTHAAVVGFLWVNDKGELVPKLVIPPDATDQVTLSQSLTELVLHQGRAVWVASQSGPDPADNIEHYADAVCVPLIHRDDQGRANTVGAVHVYLQDGRFRQSDFDFTISVANIMAVALVRAWAEVALRSNYNRLIDDQPSRDEILGESKPIVELKTKCVRIAQAGGCVLIRGESGTGKELVARAIHQASPRADRPMVSVNCSAISADLMESKLLGYKKGAFTGANRDHVGYLQQADMGTLFLDEIGKLPSAGQEKLLHILEGHPFLPVGSSEKMQVDVRLLAATNQDLAKLAREKRFREDLYHRLGVFELYVPPLRERGDDIGLLIDTFFDHFRILHGRPGLRMSDKAHTKLLAYHWPGNVRQLRNVIDSTVVLVDGDVIEASDLALRDSGMDELESLRLESWEKKLIREALLRTRDNVPQAAKLLGIGRATLYRRLEQYGIER